MDKEPHLDHILFQYSEGHNSFDTILSTEGYESTFMPCHVNAVFLLLEGSTSSSDFELDLNARCSKHTLQSFFRIINDQEMIKYCDEMVLNFKLLEETKMQHLSLNSGLEDPSSPLFDDIRGDLENVFNNRRLSLNEDIAKKFAQIASKFAFSSSEKLDLVSFFDDFCYGDVSISKIVKGFTTEDSVVKTNSAAEDKLGQNNLVDPNLLSKIAKNTLETLLAICLSGICALVFLTQKFVNEKSMDRLILLGNLHKSCRWVLGSFVICSLIRLVHGRSWGTKPTKILHCITLLAILFSSFCVSISLVLALSFVSGMKLGIIVLAMCTIGVAVVITVAVSVYQDDNRNINLPMEKNNSKRIEWFVEMLNSLVLISYTNFGLLVYNNVESQGNDKFFFESFLILIGFCFGLLAVLSSYYYCLVGYPPGADFGIYVSILYINSVIIIMSFSVLGYWCLLQPLVLLMSLCLQRFGRFTNQEIVMLTVGEHKPLALPFFASVFSAFFCSKLYQGNNSGSLLHLVFVFTSACAVHYAVLWRILLHEIMGQPYLYKWKFISSVFTLLLLAIVCFVAYALA